MPSKKHFYELLLFCLSLCYLCLDLLRPLNIQDEGNMLYGAMQVLGWQLPYRDFWTMYPLGQASVLALLFWIFNPHVLVARVFDSCIRAVIVVLCFKISKSYAGQRSAWAIALLSLVWFGTDRIFTYNAISALALALSALLFVHVEKSETLANSFIAGWIAGVIFFFRLDYAGATLAALIVHEYLKKECCLRNICRIFTGALLFFLLLIGIGFYLGGQIFFEEVFIFPLTVFPRVRSLPLNLRELATDIVIVCGILGITGAMVQIWRYYCEREAVSPQFMSLLSLYLILLGASIFRPDFPHLQALLPLAFIVAGYGVVTLGKMPLKANFVVRIIAVLLITLLFLIPLIEKQTALKDLVLISEDQANAIRFIREHTNPKDYIFSGASHHDRIFGNDISFYFLSQRRAGTYYAELHPGVADREDAQARIVKELESHNVSYIVLYSGFDERASSSSNESSGAKLLDEFIASKFSDIWKEKNYRILKRVG